MTIRNPVEWSADQVSLTAHRFQSIGHAFSDAGKDAAVPAIRHIELADLKDVLLRGLHDFASYRTDVIFICLIYPLAGLLLAQFTLSAGTLPLLFPLLSGFALIGPFAAAGLYEMSRRQEAGKPLSWTDAFGIFTSPSFAAVFKLGLVFIAIFLLWLGVALAIYRVTLGPAMPTSLASFATAVFTTHAGRTMIGLGMATGFLFALVTLAIGVVSFPLLLDRPVRMSTAIRTSVRAVTQNPLPMLMWGLIVAVSLTLGAIPLLIGLVVVMPVLGHATWHLYRKVIV